MCFPIARYDSVDSALADMAVIRSLGTEFRSLHRSGMYLLASFWPNVVLSSNDS